MHSGESDRPRVPSLACGRSVTVLLDDAAVKFRARVRARGARGTHALAAVSALVASTVAGSTLAAPYPGRPLSPRSEAWSEAQLGGIRGVTIGPIENARHPGRGYGSAAYERALDEARDLGATWVSLTPFGRVWDLTPSGIDLTFEAPFEANREAVARAIEQAHARGLRVMLVPHLWVETGGWRALIDPGTDEGWERWALAYESFVLEWAKVASLTNVELFSVGVELRSFVTTRRADRFRAIVRSVRRVYPGLLTYSANWDDAEDTLIWSEVDLIGVNAFFPLASRDHAPFSELMKGGADVAARLAWLADALNKPVVLTEIGYTTRKNPAIRPWEWPDSMVSVVVDEAAQAEAYTAIIAPLLTTPQAAGFFVWRYYADPDDVSQEAEWGFSPRGKLAELVLRDAFTARFSADGPALPGDAIGRHGARTVGLLGWEMDARPDASR